MLIFTVAALLLVSGPPAGPGEPPLCALASAFRPPPAVAGDLGPTSRPWSSTTAGPSATRPTGGSAGRRSSRPGTGSWGPGRPLIERPKVEVLGTERREGFEQRRVRVEVAPDRTTGRLPARPRRQGAVPGRAGRLLRAGDGHRPGQGAARLRLPAGQAGLRRPVDRDRPRTRSTRPKRDPRSSRCRTSPTSRPTATTPWPACPRSTRSGSA